MSICVRCGSSMYIDGDIMRCCNITCTHQYKVPIKMPTYNELLEQIKWLDEKIEELENRP